MSLSILNPNQHPHFAIVKTNCFLDEVENLMEKGKKWSMGVGPLSSIPLESNHLAKIFLVHDVVKSLNDPAHQSLPLVPSPDTASRLNKEFQKWAKDDYKVTDEMSLTPLYYIYSANPDLVRKTESLLANENESDTVIKPGVKHSVVFVYDENLGEITVEIAIL